MAPPKSKNSLPVKKPSASASGGGAKAKAPSRKSGSRSLYTPAEVNEIFRRFSVQRPEPKGELDYINPFTLLIAVVLSAQATDTGVNKATKALFSVADTPQKVLALGEAKAKAKLPGVGRKTANVVLNVAFGRHTMAVDTHIFRIGNRIGLAPGKTPEQVEQGLLKVIPAEYMRQAHHWLILHGRYVCKARKPDCPACVIADICKSKEKTTDVPAPLVPIAPPKEAALAEV